MLEESMESAAAVVAKGTAAYGRSRLPESVVRIAALYVAAVSTR
jgi:hypothetical protein